MTNLTILGLFALLCLCAGCASNARSAPSAKRWAIVLHGGAGFLPRDLAADQRQAYEDSLRSALQHGADMLEAGHPALDAVETVVRVLEDDPLYNAGRGGVFAADGVVRHDASIMDGRDRNAGATTGTTTVKHPITLARRVMSDTKYVFLSGDGAEAFADESGVERVDNSYFHVEARRADLEHVLAKRWGRDLGSTVGCVALDASGHLAAATSTGGLTGKRWGRIGDSPVIGAGTFADDRSCAVSGTGVGEAFIRAVAAHEIHARVLYQGLTLEEATRRLIDDTLNEGEGGVIAVDAMGHTSARFNTPSMPYGRADADGLFEIGIWKE